MPLRLLRCHAYYFVFAVDDDYCLRRRRAADAAIKDAAAMFRCFATTTLP